MGEWLYEDTGEPTVDNDRAYKLKTNDRRFHGKINSLVRGKIMKLETIKTLGETKTELCFTHASCGSPYDYRYESRLTAKGKNKAEAIAEMNKAINGMEKVLKHTREELNSL